MEIPLIGAMWASLVIEQASLTLMCHFPAGLFLLLAAIMCVSGQRGVPTMVHPACCCEFTAFHSSAPRCSVSHRSPPPHHYTVFLCSGIEIGYPSEKQISMFPADSGETGVVTGQKTETQPMHPLRKRDVSFSIRILV